MREEEGGAVVEDTGDTVLAQVAESTEREREVLTAGRRWDSQHLTVSIGPANNSISVRVAVNYMLTKVGSLWGKRLCRGSHRRKEWGAARWSLPEEAKEKTM